MIPWLDVVLPVASPGVELAPMIDSLAGQTERGFRVLLCGDAATSTAPTLTTAASRLQAEGIPVELSTVPFPLTPVEHLNWAHDQARADWIKPLLSGDRLRPDYAAALRQRISERPAAQVVWCGFQFPGAAGRQAGVPAPFPGTSITPSEFLKHFPGPTDWFGGSANWAYGRAAWRSLGGWENLLPTVAGDYFFTGLVMHYGLELIPTQLAVLAGRGSPPSPGSRQSRWVEGWLERRALRNLARTTRLPWRGVAAPTPTPAPVAARPPAAQP